MGFSFSANRRTRHGDRCFHSSRNETCCATREEITSAGQCQGKSGTHWTLIQVLLRYLSVLGVAPGHLAEVRTRRLVVVLRGYGPTDISGTRRVVGSIPRRPCTPIGSVR